MTTDPASPRASATSIPADLLDLTVCLARPVARGWLSLPIADAVVLMAAFRADLSDLDPLAIARHLQQELREAARE